MKISVDEAKIGSEVVTGIRGEEAIEINSTHGTMMVTISPAIKKVPQNRRACIVVGLSKGDLGVGGGGGRDLVITKAAVAFC